MSATEGQAMLLIAGGVSKGACGVSRVGRRCRAAATGGRATLLIGVLYKTTLCGLVLCLPAMTASDVGKRFPILLYSLFTFVCVGVWVRVCGCVCLFAIGPRTK